MKKAFILIALLFGSIGMAGAQDIITTKDGSDIQARILEVTNSEIKYKRFSNLEGPTFTINKSDILIIRYENGENEVFKESSNQRNYQQTPHRGHYNSNGTNTDAEIWEGMRYKEYSSLYDPRYYIAQPGDLYSPTWCGVASMIPGLGQALAGEWGRAAGFFFSCLGLNSLYIVALSEYETTLATLATLCNLAVNIWSIVDAMNVAKIKNMYWQDINTQRYSFNLDVEPLLTCAPAAGTANNMQPVAGLSVKLSF